MSQTQLNYRICLSLTVTILMPYLISDHARLKTLKIAGRKSNVRPRLGPHLLRAPFR